jgi:hypothetical protein
MNEVRRGYIEGMYRDAIMHQEVVSSCNRLTEEVIQQQEY